MELLVLTDFHFAGAGARSSIPTRRGDLIPQILEEVRKRETGIDALAVLGDVIENGLHPAARADLQAVKAQLEAFGVPMVCVPGNHDRSPALFAEVFGPCEPVQLGSFRLIPFADTYDEQDICTRDFPLMKRRFSGIRPGETVIVCQHSAILPKVESSYPYPPPRHLEIADAYRRAGVSLSLSGHYHDGMAPVQDGSCMHLCVPALCEQPFSYARIRIGESGIEPSVRSLGKDL